jgi:hypothetical protein
MTATAACARDVRGSQDSSRRVADAQVKVGSVRYTLRAAQRGFYRPRVRRKHLASGCRAVISA